MKNWKLNYYKTLEKFVKHKIKELENEGFSYDEDPLDTFLSFYEQRIFRERFSYENPKTWKPDWKYPPDTSSGFLDFQNLLLFLKNMNPFDGVVSQHTMKSWKYGNRNPSPKVMKELIKMSNGSLIYESFMNVVDQPFENYHTRVKNSSLQFNSTTVE